MERRALIAVVISLVILVLYQEVVIKRFYPPSDLPPGDIANLRDADPPPPAPDGSAPLAPPSPAEPPEEVRAVAVPAGRDIVVETDLYRAVFTTAGARLKSLQLLKYRTTVDANSQPLELILHPVAHDLPLGVQLRGPDTSVSDAGVLYQVDSDGIDLAGDATATLTFRGESSAGQLTKRVEVRGNRYLFGVQVEAENVASPYSEMTVAWHEGLPGMGPGHGEILFDTVLALHAGKLQREAFADLEAGKVIDNDVSWVGFSGKYFAALMVPDAPPENALRVWMKRRAETVETQLLLPPGEFSQKLELYLGPNDIATLEEAGHSLRRAVDLGWFTFVALPLLQALRLMHGVIGNYGVCIILLTVLIKILFIPLTQKSLKSMRAMQKLQPQMTAIREQFKDKPDQMNKEIMELYKRHKVNPLGGCLPMVLQIPVFIGLYQGLLNAVELRHAPFFGWINDLSAPDRLGSVQLPFVDGPGFPMLTLVMGGSMFAQQMMTPSAGDPTQQRVMLIMPVMFTFMFINFPSGLTLYWLVNNILTIVQQLTVNRQNP